MWTRKIIETSNNNDLSGASLDFLFVTPFMRYVWPDSAQLNSVLKELIRDHEQKDQGLKGEYSNVGGWHSKVNFHQFDHESVRIVLDRFHKMLQKVTEQTIGRPQGGWHVEYEIEAWANINRFGDYNMPHSHASSWALVYYVDAGKNLSPKSRSGAMELYDPRSAAAVFGMPGEFFNHRFFVYPESGLMVLFPGWLTHFVNPYYGEGERISIACNVNITGVSYD